MMFKAKIYIAGPYSQGDVAQNVYEAIRTANDLADKGFAPFVPHFTHFWHMMFHRPYEFWLELDKQFLSLCDGLLRLPGESVGSDKEVKFAEELNKPVFNSIRELEEYYGKEKF